LKSTTPFIGVGAIDRVAGKEIAQCHCIAPSSTGILRNGIATERAQQKQQATDKFPAPFLVRTFPQHVPPHIDQSIWILLLGVSVGNCD
jgi:hypothetical protein